MASEPPQRSQRSTGRRHFGQPVLLKPAPMYSPEVAFAAQSSRTLVNAAAQSARGRRSGGRHPRADSGRQDWRALPEGVDTRYSAPSRPRLSRGSPGATRVWRAYARLQASDHHASRPASTGARCASRFLIHVELPLKKTSIVHAAPPDGERVVFAARTARGQRLLSAGVGPADRNERTELAQHRAAGAKDPWRRLIFATPAADRTGATIHQVHAAPCLHRVFAE